MALDYTISHSVVKDFFLIQVALCSSAETQRD